MFQVFQKFVQIKNFPEFRCSLQLLVICFFEMSIGISFRISAKAKWFVSTNLIHCSLIPDVFSQQYVDFVFYFISVCFFDLSAANLQISYK